MGGLLSAYHLSSFDPIYLEKAVALADRMLPVFDTPTGLPLSMINLAKREGVPDESGSPLISTAEASTLQLEFRYLSHLTDDDIYWEKAEKVLTIWIITVCLLNDLIQVMEVIKKALMPHGLVAIYMNPDVGQFLMSDIRLGSRGDSYYEYLLKQYLQTVCPSPLTKIYFPDSFARTKPRKFIERYVHKVPILMSCANSECRCMSKQ